MIIQGIIARMELGARPRVPLFQRIHCVDQVLRGAKCGRKIRMDVTGNSAAFAVRRTACVSVTRDGCRLIISTTRCRVLSNMIAEVDGLSACAAIVHQNRNVAGEDVVGVQTVDRQVVGSGLLVVCVDVSEPFSSCSGCVAGQDFQVVEFFVGGVSVLET
jgi:hypothetical protein